MIYHFDHIIADLIVSEDGNEISHFDLKLIRFIALLGCWLDGVHYLFCKVVVLREPNLYECFDELIWGKRTFAIGVPDQEKVFGYFYVLSLTFSLLLLAHGLAFFVLRSLSLVALEPFLLPPGTQILQRTLTISKESLATHELLEPAVGAVGSDKELRLSTLALLVCWLKLRVLSVVITGSILFSALLQLVGDSIGVIPCRLTIRVLPTFLLSVPLL